MSSFLKFAYELLSQVVYNIVSWLVAFLNLFITGWVQYFLIFKTYFFSFGIPQKILSILLMILLFAIPVTILILLVRKAIMHHQLKADKTDNAALYKEIGRLNKQVLSLMDEKNSILALKVNAMGGTKRIPYVGASALTDDVIPTLDNVTGGAGAASGVSGVAATVEGASGEAVSAGPVSQAVLDHAPVVKAVVTEQKDKVTYQSFSKTYTGGSGVCRLSVSGIR